MNNQQISAIFSEMADIMEILGQDAFRINTYRKVARVVKECDQDVATLAADKGVESLAGVGKSSAAKIHEFVHGGTIGAHQELSKQIPPGLLELLKIPGLGPKGVRAVWQGLKVCNLADLKRVIKDHSLETLPKFGAKKAQTLEKGISFLESGQGRTLLVAGLAIADVIAGQLLGKKIVERIELAGSARRCQETIGSITLLAEGEDDKGIIEAFIHLPGVLEVTNCGPGNASVRYGDANICKDVIQAVLYVVPSRSMGAAQFYYTGSTSHTTRLHEIAARKNMTLNEKGLFNGDNLLAGNTEQGIYKKLGLEYVPPTLREDQGEIERAQKKKLPRLIQLADIQGDMHMHTTESDGRATLEEMMAAAKHLGYRYIAVTNHSHSSVIANGLDLKRLSNQIEQVKRANEKDKDIEVLASSEVDILMDGTLDYPDEILAELDFVMASVHSGMTGSQEKLTTRLLRAMENPYVNCIGHPTGRLITVREPMQLDMPAIIRQAAVTRTALEVSAQPQRLDLKDSHVRMAIEAGVKLMIDTDAHDILGLRLMRYGVATAQRGWATKKDVLNSQPVKMIHKWVQDKRP
ncbi:MAG: DNA polymerase/3'-5' exonuclease PolX [Phycisphaerae bacterium]|nr:DNA polymerase/3'-5' exonuclease PolX [Phycisphaerae bacterium]